MLSSLTGKLALITGAASGIGLSSAEHFAKHGTHLILSDRSKKVEDVAQAIAKENPNVKVHAVPCDVTQSSQVNNMFDQIKKIHPDLLPTILVNSAGVGYPSEFLKMTEKEFDQTVSINLKGTFLVSQTLSKILVENFPKHKFQTPLESYASIINLSSQAAKAKSFNIAHYASSKAGVDGLTRSISKEMGPYRVRCNSVLPYFIETPMTDFIKGDLRNTYIKLTSLGRFGKPEEVSQLILFLASDASSFITGTSIDIAGQ